MGAFVTASGLSAGGTPEAAFLGPKTSEPVVEMIVSGHPLLVPERVLCAAAGHLDQAMGGCVPLAGYVEAAEILLSALQRRGLISLGA